MKLKNHPGSAKKTMRAPPDEEDDYPVDEEITGSSFLAAASDSHNLTLNSAALDGT